jgi:adenylate cyclase class 2
MADYEVEAKFALPDPPLLRGKLAELGAVPGPPLAQCDTYFAHPARDFARTDEAFRLRRVGEQNALTYKGPLVDRQTKTRQEIEVPVAPGTAAAAKIAEMLRALGFREVRTVEKTRQPFRLSRQGREFELALDTVAGLGEFLEIETKADEAEWEAARDALLALADELGLRESERRSYLQLLLDQDSGGGGIKSGIAPR